MGPIPAPSPSLILIPRNPVSSTHFYLFNDKHTIGTRKLAIIGRDIQQAYQA